MGRPVRNSQRATKRMMVVSPLTVLLILSLLFWVFRSVRLASLMQGMVPFTLIGVLAALGVAGLHLSVSAAVGFIAVAGLGLQGNGRDISTGQGTPASEGGSAPFTTPVISNFHAAQLTVGYVPDVFGGDRRQVESPASQAKVQRHQLQAT